MDEDNLDWQIDEIENVENEIKEPFTTFDITNYQEYIAYHNPDKLDPEYRAKPGFSLFSKTIKGKRAELKDLQYFKDVIQELFRVYPHDLQVGSDIFSPELLWQWQHRDIVFNHLQGYRDDFTKNWDIFTDEEKVILQNFIDRSLEYEKEWRVDHDHSMRCPLFLDMDKVLAD